MAKIIATYEVKIVVRFPDDVEESAGSLPEPPTLEELTGAIERDFEARYGFEANATAERSDK
jgi:hypothetical protein